MSIEPEISRSSSSDFLASSFLPASHCSSTRRASGRTSFFRERTAAAAASRALSVSPALNWTQAR